MYKHIFFCFHCFIAAIPQEKYSPWKLKTKIRIADFGRGNVTLRRVVLSLFLSTFLPFLFHYQNSVEIVRFMAKKGSMPGYTLGRPASRGRGGAVRMGMISLGQDLAATVLEALFFSTCLAG
jgi:hypothetical protein